MHSPNELMVKGDIESMLALYQVLLHELQERGRIFAQYGCNPTFVLLIKR